MLTLKNSLKIWVLTKCKNFATYFLVSYKDFIKLKTFWGFIGTLILETLAKWKLKALLRVPPFIASCSNFLGELEMTLTSIIAWPPPSPGKEGAPP